MASMEKQYGNTLGVYNPLSDYIMRITGACSTSKVLYLDSETTGIIAQLLSQSQALAEDIFLIHQLGVKIPDTVGASNLSHLSAIIFCRPTHKNVEKIITHLRNPKHQAYYIFFSNQLEEPSLARLAQADQYEVVQQVQELFADVYPLCNDLWSLEQKNQSLYYMEEKEWNNDQSEQFERELEGLSSFLLAVKKRPLIRWQKSSSLAEKLADKVRDMIDTEKELFGWSEPDIRPLLLICDRREDPITPLLSQWTYQAMVHELMGIHNSRCKLPKDNKGEVVLNPFDDTFFAKNKSATFGDLGANVKKLVDKFAKQVKGSRNIQSINDMQKFVENYGDYLAKQGNVSKHVAVMGELSAIVSSRKLLDISAVEQEIVCGNDHKTHFVDVERSIKDPSVHDWDKLRLAILYALRYQSKGKDKSSQLRTLLRQNIMSKEVSKDIALLDIMVRHFGCKKREMTLFDDEKQNSNIINKLGSIVKAINGMDEVQNIYTQHNPLLYGIIQDAVKCKLPWSQFPSFQGAHKQQLRRPRYIMIYFVGGATFEEAETVTQLNKEFGKDTDIVLGTGMIHNSRSFLRDVKTTYGRNIIYD
eukprot:990528_1